MAQAPKTGGSQQQSSAWTQDQVTVALCVILAVVVSAVFFPATRNRFVNFDDNLYVTENPQVQQGLSWAGLAYAFRGTISANWHPLTCLSHMADCQFFGLNPWGHHLTSVLLHAADTALLFLVFQVMTGARWRSFALAALFGLHPLRVESVAWVSERKDVLSTLFWLLTMLAYVKYVLSAPAEDKPNGKPEAIRTSRAWYVGALILFLLGLMSKPMLVTLPFALLLLDYWPLNRWPAKSWRAIVLEKLPFFVLALGSSLTTLLVQRHAGAVAQVLPLGARLGNAVVAYVRYLGKLFWPSNLCVAYPHPDQWPGATIAGCTLLLLIITALALWQLKIRSYFATGWCWYLGTLVPVIGLVQVGQQSIADRYTYIPTIGILWAVVWAASECARRVPRAAPVVQFVGAAAVVACIPVTRIQLGYWADSESLFGRAAAVTKDNWVAYGNLAKALADKGKIDEAIAEYRKVLQLRPDEPIASNGLAVLLGKRGKADESIRLLDQVLKRHPNDAPTHNNLGMLLAGAGRADDAIAQFHTAVAIQPDFADAQHNLGILLSTKGRFEEAVGHYEQAICLQPNFVKARKNLAIALFRLGRLDDAIAQLQEAVRLQPDYAEARGRLDALLAMKRSQPNPPATGQKP
jgi:tetratricopeptide (TPR) repeat protein